MIFGPLRAYGRGVRCPFFIHLLIASIGLLTMTGPAFAAEIYYQMGADGIPMLTDSPRMGAHAQRFDRSRHTQQTKPVNVEGIARIDAYDHLFIAASKQYDIPAELVKAVCLVESGMNPNAVSRAGAQGLMQLMPKTAQSLKVTDPFDPTQAIYGGAKYLSRQLRSFGRNDYALAAYNAGPGAVKRAGGIPNYTETQRYVKKVMRYYDHFRQQRPVQPKR